MTFSSNINNIGEEAAKYIPFILFIFISNIFLSLFLTDASHAKKTREKSQSAASTTKTEYKSYSGQNGVSRVLMTVLNIIILIMISIVAFSVFMDMDDIDYVNALLVSTLILSIFFIFFGNFILHRFVLNGKKYKDNVIELSKSDGEWGMLLGMNFFIFIDTVLLLLFSIRSSF